MSDLSPDWDKLQAAHEALREHMLIIAELKDALKLAVAALEFAHGGEPLPTMELEAIVKGKALLDKLERA
jgi:hypothetical protein